MGLRDQLKPKQSKLTTHQQAVDGDAPATYLTGIGRYYDKLEFNDRALKCSVPEPV